MIQEEFHFDKPIRWGMAGGGRGSQIGYIHRCAATRDSIPTRLFFFSRENRFRSWTGDRGICFGMRRW